MNRLRIFRLGTPFIYVHFRMPLLAGLYLADLFLIPVIGVLLYYVIYGSRLLKRNQLDIEHQRGFYTDTAITLNEENRR
jgi:hypothetical protein